jgi:hypothetical protein
MRRSERRFSSWKVSARSRSLRFSAQFKELTKQGVFNHLLYVLKNGSINEKAQRLEK